MTVDSDSDAPVLLRPRLQAALCVATVILIAGLLIWSEGFAGQSAAPNRGRSIADPTVPALVIDLNVATLQELMLMPGIGPKTAARILADRRQRGPFDGVKDLQRVAGIGPKTVQSIEPYCRAAVSAGGERVADR